MGSQGAFWGGTKGLRHAKGDGKEQQDPIHPLFEALLLAPAKTDTPHACNTIQG